MTRHTLDEAARALRIEIAGDLLSTNFDALNGEIQGILESAPVVALGWTSLHLDMTAAKLIDSMGLNIIVGLVKKAQARSAKIHARIASQTIHRTFLFTRLEKYMEVELVEKK